MEIPVIRNVSGAVAFICFASVAALPWWILATGRPGWRELAAFATWVAIGTLAVAVRDGGSRG
jgi:hypothetical protein